MPSFAKFGLVTNSLASKVNGPKEEVKQPKEQQDEVGPEYMSIDPAENLPSGFFYLAKKEEQAQYEKTSPRKKSIVLDLPGVLVSFADPKAESIYSAQCVELGSSDEQAPKRFVYFWEREDLHWFLKRLRGAYEIIIWSSLGKVLTEQVVKHIERDNSYFALVLSRQECLSFQDRKPTNPVLAHATLSAKKDGQKGCLEVSFSSISKALQPKGVLKDITLLLK